MLSVSSFSWSDISTAFVSEAFIRNVRWVIQKYPGMLHVSYLPYSLVSLTHVELNTYVPNSDLDRNRLGKTFIASQTSMQLLQYNVYFLEHIGRPRGPSFVPFRNL